MPRRVLEGIVTSNKMDKTITVLVERRTMHPIYKKYIRSTKKYAAHDEHNAASEGDKVQIMECSPISKRKSWTLLVDGKEVTTKAEKPAPVAKKEAAPKKAAAKKPAAKKTAKKA